MRRRRGRSLRTFTLALVGSSMLAPIAGCGREPTYVGEARSASAPPEARGGGPPVDPRTYRSPLETQGAAIGIAPAIEALAVETCAREGRCGRVGGGHRWVDARTCREDVERDARTRIDTEVCPTGYLDDAYLRACIEAIRTAPCEGDQDLWQTVCKPDELCAP